MNNEEANRVIAEYMGAVFYDTHDPSPILILDGYEIPINGFNKYTKSLDTLVPVWEKARISNVCQFDFNRIGNNYEFLIFQDRPDKDYGNQWYAKEPTLQQAAAHATAKAILELKNE
jgi:hypothetical protein